MWLAGIIIRLTLAQAVLIEVSGTGLWVRDVGDDTCDVYFCVDGICKTRCEPIALVMCLYFASFRSILRIS